MPEQKIPSESAIEERVERYLSAGNGSAALSAARELLACDPERGDFHTVALRAAVAAGEQEAAANHLLQAKRLDGENPSVHYLDAYHHLERHRSRKAETAILKALSLDPEDADTWTLYGWICLERGDAPAAVRCGEKARALDATDIEADRVLIEARRRMGDGMDRLGQRTLTELRKALSLDPENALLHEDVGDVFLELEDEPLLAEASYREALRLAPTARRVQTKLLTAIRKRSRVLNALYAPWRGLKKWFAEMADPESESIPILAFISAAIGLLAWAIFVYPIIKAYEFFTAAEVWSEASGLKRNAPEGRRFSFHTLPPAARMGLFALTIVAVWVAGFTIVTSPGFWTWMWLVVRIGLVALAACFILSPFAERRDARRAMSRRRVIEKML